MNTIQQWALQDLNLWLPPCERGSQNGPISLWISRHGKTCSGLNCGHFPVQVDVIAFRGCDAGMAQLLAYQLDRGAVGNAARSEAMPDTVHAGLDFNSQTRFQTCPETCEVPSQRKTRPGLALAVCEDDGQGIDRGRVKHDEQSAGFLQNPLEHGNGLGDECYLLCLARVSPALMPGYGPDSLFAINITPKGLRDLGKPTSGRTHKAKNLLVRLVRSLTKLFKRVVWHVRTAFSFTVGNGLEWIPLDALSSSRPIETGFDRTGSLAFCAKGSPAFMTLDPIGQHVSLALAYLQIPDMSREGQKCFLLLIKGSGAVQADGARVLKVERDHIAHGEGRGVHGSVLNQSMDTSNPRRMEASPPEPEVVGPGGTLIIRVSSAKRQGEVKVFYS